ncbi:helix-turn-helix transcriptional regulator [Calidifontibacter sp. DB0510]|uniref:Helix-turn-helix transcriptional regulator n=1 Tax=Metallococcus carri TaxID=1656884 RepID=A0A967B1B5_9MICO|nr:DUF5937 family protein [Metallococcus carri]NHN56984.1 helix-turn-helix transcriptional regulator [Metallococcus carri]NOP37729.1 helix-turn-helix transcriptional regulator [Calidifontibacter sp. DB2511S]
MTTPVRFVAAADLARLRFATSPLWETVASVRVLRDGAGGALHAPWRATARERIVGAGASFPVLDALIPPSGHLADFLTPTPSRRSNAFETELTAVAKVPVEVVLEDLQTLLAASPTKAAAQILTDGLDDPDALRDKAIDELRDYWSLTVSRVWDRLRGLADSDIAWRLDLLADGGGTKVLGTLHPRVRMDEDRLAIENSCKDGPTQSGHGVVLVPCAFGWPDLLLFNVPDYALTLTYAPRGVGMLWRDAPDPQASPLTELMGRTRAAAIQLLDLPMTTAQLACHLDLTPSTANEHLKILERSGLVAATRRGRSVLYARTPLGAGLATQTG